MSDQTIIAGGKAEQLEKCNAAFSGPHCHTWSLLCHPLNPLVLCSTLSIDIPLKRVLNNQNPRAPYNKRLSGNLQSQVRQKYEIQE